MIRLLGYLSCLVVLNACFWGTQKNRNYTVVNLNAHVSEAAIPTDLWDLIESIYTREHALEEAKDRKKSEHGNALFSIEKKRSKVEASLRRFGIKVYLSENQYGILGGQDYQLEYGPGGGDLDLKDYVKEDIGSFTVKIGLDVAFEEAKEAYVFYWGNGKRREVDGDVYGSQCERVFDLTGYFKGHVFTDGIVVTTHKKKYVTLLAGTYVFVVKQEGYLYISQLTVRDSRYAVLHCRNFE